jgi:hypothetical protein
MMSISVVDEFAAIDFNDERLTKRLCKVAELVSDCPHVSLPAAAAGGRADLEGAYRFFNNSKVTPERILSTHQRTTIERINDSNTDLIVISQDTSKCDLTRPNQQVAGAGYLGGNQKYGLYLHPLLASTLERLPLGIVGQQNYKRLTISKLSKSEKRKRRQSKPLEEKESFRWLQGLHQAKQVARQCPEKACVIVQDSEGDINELLCADRSLGDARELHLIVRGGQARVTTEGKLVEVLRQQPVRFQRTIAVSPRNPKIACTKHRREQQRKPRQAVVDIRARTVELTPNSAPEKLVYQVVLVEEVDPPADSEPVQWILITSLPVATERQVKQIIQAYCVRWQIEIFFRVLKTGCRIEKRQFETIEGIENVIALFMVIAWRIMYLTMLGRECPAMNCEMIFQDYEWMSIYKVLKKPIPDTPPSLKEVVCTIAQLGGYIDRPGTEPGPETLWKGMQAAYFYGNAWLAFGPKEET